jgi:uncharacterized protein with NRDE domain
MSLLAIVYHLVPESPILAAFNREETFDKNFSSPSIHSGKPRVLASLDAKTSGTCLGVNQNGMFVSIIKRPKYNKPMNPLSRGALGREILKCTSARSGVDLAMEQLHTDRYDGANFVIADSESGWIVQSGKETEVVELEQGLTVVGEYDVNDHEDRRAAMATRLLTLQTLDSPVKFLAVASKVLARAPGAPGRPSMVVRENDYGTISSTLISLGKKPRDAIYQYANGAPDQSKYEDYSPMLRDILSRGLREARAKASA